MPTRRPTMMRTRDNRIAKYATDSDYEIDEELFRAKLGSKNEFIVYSVVKAYGDQYPIYIGGETRPGADIYENRNEKTALDFAEGYAAGFRAASSK